MNFKIREREKIFAGKVFDIQVDKIEYESGNSGVREVVVHNGGAVAVPVTPDGKIVLVKQFRYPFQEKLLELPAGKLEKGEDPLKCAARELTEETGYSAGETSKLGSVYSSPGFCTEELHIYLASNLEMGNHSREEGEYGMEVIELSLDEANEKIANGEIKDSKTICGIHYFEYSLRQA